MKYVKLYAVLLSAVVSFTSIQASESLSDAQLHARVSLLSRRDVRFLCIGCVVGSLIGVVIAEDFWDVVCEGAHILASPHDTKHVRY